MSERRERSTSGNAVGSAYWYGDEARSQRGRAVLQALREYREAEMATRRRTQGSMGMNETDLAALRNIIAVTGRGQHVSPKDLAQHLDISPASVSNLLERLEPQWSCAAHREPRRRPARVVERTDLAHREVRATLRDMHSQMMLAVEDLTADEATTVIRFLEQLRRSVALPVESHAAA